MNAELVIVNVAGDVVCSLRPENVVKSNGTPLFGPMVRRVMTAAEVQKFHGLPTKRQGAKMRAANIKACLILP